MKPPPLPPSLLKPAVPQGQPPEGARSVDRQLSRLFGESLFGAWLEPLESVPANRRERKPGRWGKRLGILLLLAVAAAAGTWLYRRGLARRAGEDRAQAAKDVATFLAEGELDRLAQFVAILLPPEKPLPASDPYLDLIVSAESVLYRYQDAAPGRLARIEPYLSSDKSHPTRLLARFTVGSEPERAEDYETLLSLSGSLPKDPEYHAVAATVLEQRGDAKAVRASWERSFQAGPLWLPHRYRQCAFEARQRNTAAVARIVEHMVRVAPESGWTRLAVQQFAPAMTLPAGTWVPKPASPVAQYHAELGQVLQILGAQNLPSARPVLGRALAAVHGQAPFVLDAFAALIEAHARDLAIEMSSYEVWPRKSSWAEARLASLQASSAVQKDASASTPAGAKTAAGSGKSKAKKGGAGHKRGGKAKKHGGRRRR